MRRRIALFVAAACVAAAFITLPGPSRAAVEDAAAGKKIFDEKCQSCHSATSNAAKIGPGLKGLYKNGKMPASGKPVNDANVRKQILDGGNGMPGFKGVIDDAGVADLIAYLKTL